MLKSSVRLFLVIVRAKFRLVLAPEFKGRIVINIALFNTPPATLITIFFVRGVKLIIIP